MEAQVMEGQVINQASNESLTGEVIQANSAPAKRDFSMFFLAVSGTVAINMPNGKPMMYEGKQVTVDVYGPGSLQHIKATEFIQNEATKRILIAAGNTDVKEDPDADVKYLLAITRSINNFPYEGGAKAIYSEPRLNYIAHQVRAYVGRAGNFFEDADVEQSYMLSN
ncbi:hypothetical protein [Nitrosomonas sp. Nm34]|uniref:hypothetical protein n=1 Tax=Nitrosomonas sp. Nm34 TaxID=1881055 RepID=UPI0008E5DB97|nr:hypothetical protein [Nitrosomonas sp. Nm34]SFI31482.1 hypothetical protein SAMN05428978_100574 [Nitrosomonas sp. Nm34]